jgi:hypothetical protein
MYTKFTIAQAKQKALMTMANKDVIRPPHARTPRTCAMAK